MKKLFLTSGIIACMACPAFAEGTGFQPTGNPPAVPAGSVSGACVENYLGATSGDVQLQAQWDINYSTINLLTNTEQNGWDNSSAVSQTPIYAEVGNSNNLFTMNSTTHNLETYASYNTNSNTTPLGKTQTITYDYNLPTVGTVSAGHTLQGTYTQYEASTAVTNYAATATTQNRLFNGFWSADTGGDQYIGDDGTILPLGKTTAAAYAAESTHDWYAQYKCASPSSIAAPSMTGYEFAGWYNGTGTGAQLIGTLGSGAWCVTDDTMVAHAKWTPHSGTITYSCGTQPGTEAQTGTQPSSQTVNYDEEINLAANTCVYEGWNFTGWSCTYDLGAGTAGNTPYSDAALVLYKVPADDAAITCTAQWARNQIDLHWDVNHADTYTANGGNSCDYDSAVVVPSNPSRVGYTFTGWDVVEYTSTGVNTGNTPTEP